MNLLNSMLWKKPDVKPCMLMSPLVWIIWANLQRYIDEWYQRLSYWKGIAINYKISFWSDKEYYRITYWWWLHYHMNTLKATQYSFCFKIYLFIHYCSFIHSLYCGVQMHGCRVQRKPLFVLYCAPRVSLRQNLSLHLELMFSGFSQLGWKTRSPSYPPASQFSELGLQICREASLIRGCWDLNSSSHWVHKCSSLSSHLSSSWFLFFESGFHCAVQVAWNSFCSPE